MNLPDRERVGKGAVITTWVVLAYSWLTVVRLVP